MEQLPALLSGRGKSLSGNIGEILSLSLHICVLGIFLTLGLPPDEEALALKACGK